MSRTDKTRPISIRMLDAQDNKIGLQERHNHLKGFCDLPEKDPKAVEKQHNDIMNSEDKSFGTSCFYAFSYKGSNYCGCKMCTGQDWRKEERRAKRHNAKTSLLNHKKAVNAKLQEVDDMDEDLSFLEPEDDRIPSISWS